MRWFSFVSEGRERRVTDSLAAGTNEGRRGFSANGTTTTTTFSFALSRLRCLREIGGGALEEGSVEL